MRLQVLIACDKVTLKAALAQALAENKQGL